MGMPRFGHSIMSFVVCFYWIHARVDFVFTKFLNLSELSECVLDVYIKLHYILLLVATSQFYSPIYRFIFRADSAIDDVSV